MDEHIQFLETLRRLCGTNLPRTRVSAANKESFKSELWMKLRINIDLDSREIHPSSIHLGRKRFLYRVRGCTLKNNFRKSRILHINVVNQRVSSPSGKHKPKRYLFTGLSHLQVSYLYWREMNLSRFRDLTPLSSLLLSVRVIWFNLI